MDIKQAEFITSAPTLAEAPDWTLPEIAFVGRSNVGKSSMINRLVHRKNLAKTSNTPGKTRLMNFYRINQTFALVDLPGYGYAKVSKTEQAAWRKQFEKYLVNRPNLKLVVQLIDAKVGPQPNDTQMLEWLVSKDLPMTIVLTKLDKIPKHQWAKQAATVAKLYNVPVDSLGMFSAESGWGKDDLLRLISEMIDAPAEKA